MVKIDVLSAVIKESGMTMTAIARKSGIKRETLYARLNGVGEFTASEIIGLSKTLHLSKSDTNIIFLS